MTNSKNLMKIVKLKMKIKEFTVFLRDKWIDDVFFQENTTPEEVKKSLIEHDGYDPDIEVSEVDS